MKKLLFISILFLLGFENASAVKHKHKSPNIAATTYYVSSSTGNDSYTPSQAQSPSTPWASIQHANAMAGAGTQILFNSGDIFYGSISPGANNIAYGAYGTGAKPVISGLKTVSGWTNLGSGIWESSTISGVRNSLKVVTLNGIIQERGRWPNRNSTDGGYRTYNPSGSTITDLVSGTFPAKNFAAEGASAVIVYESYRTNTCTITGQSGTTLTYTSPTDYFNNSVGYAFHNGYGYFITDDSTVLDQFGEWYLNKATGKLRMFFGIGVNPSGYTIQASVQDYGIKTSNIEYGISRVSDSAYTNITVNGLDLEGFNKYGFYAFNNDGITFQNNTVNNCFTGFHEWYSANTTVSNNDFNNCLNTAIMGLTQLGKSSLTITNNHLHNIGQFEGMHGNGDGPGMGIQVWCNGAQIMYNRLDTIGYTGIYFNGANVNVQYNWCHYFCNRKEDGGAFYTYGDTAFTGRTVDHNIAVNGVDNQWGVSTDKFAAAGLYNDGQSRGVSWTNNVVGFCGGTGVLLNDPVNVRLDSNIVYQCPDGVDVTRNNTGSQSIGGVWTNNYSPYLTDNSVTYNTFIASAYDVNYVDSKIHQPTPTHTFAQDFTGLGYGTWDHNLYSSFTSPAGPLGAYYQDTSYQGVAYNYLDQLWGYASMTLAQWKKFTTKDANSSMLTNSAASGLYYNSSTVAVDSVFTGFQKVDQYGNVYNNKITIQPYTGVILFDNGTVNAPPVATITGITSITLPTSSVTLSGASSYDPDGTVSSYAWTVQPGAPNTPTINSASGASTVINGLIAGTYQFQLSVTDNNSAVTTTTVNVTVNPAIVIPPAGACTDCIHTNFYAKP